MLQNNSKFVPFSKITQSEPLTLDILRKKDIIEFTYIVNNNLKKLLKQINI